jgi:hypothetical protein
MATANIKAGPDVMHENGEPQSEIPPVNSPQSAVKVAIAAKANGRRSS